MGEERKGTHPQVSRLADLYTDGKMTRRQFVRNAALLGLSLSGAASLFSSCAPAEPDDDTPEQPAVDVEEVATPTPSKRGGVFRLAGSADFRSLDPPGAEWSEDWWSAGCLLYNQLYFYDTEGGIYPDLASEMPEISEDGTVYTIPLRKGIQFHNGREMVAEDVKFSLERQLWPDVYSWGKGYMRDVVGYEPVMEGETEDLAGVQVVDDHTITIRLDKAQSAFLNLLTYSMNGIIPKGECLEAGDDWGHEVVIGTGPFKFVEWQRGVRGVYERNPDYHWGAPYLDGIELYVNVDASVQMLRWEAGELEFVRIPPPEIIPTLLTDPEFERNVLKTPTTGHSRLCFNFNSEPFQDIRVRQAIAHAIDKDAMVRAYAGMINKLEGFYNPTMLQYDAEFKSDYQFDPEKAKQLLADAGYPDGIDGLRMFAATEKEAELVQEDLSRVGIEATIVLGTWSEWRDPIRAGDVELFIYSWSASAPDAYDYVSAWCTCDSVEAGYNDGHYCNERIDQLLAQAERLPLVDPERVALYREIEETIINDDVAWVGLSNSIQVSLVHEHCKDVEPFFIYSGWPRLEKAWMET